MKHVTGRQAAIAIITWLIALAFLTALLSGCTVTMTIDGISTPPAPSQVDNPAFSG